MHDHVVAQAGIRLPLYFDGAAFVGELVRWAEARVGVTPGSTALPPLRSEEDTCLAVQGELTRISLRLSAHELAFRGDRNSVLVRSFLGAVRSIEPAAKPGFVLKSGTSDMNVVGPAWQCPIVAYGPGDSSLDHTPHEHLALDEYWRAVLVLEQALRLLVE
jgi:LysW-gamma-L-lysine carboxypeptidase